MKGPRAHAMIGTFPVSSRLRVRMLTGLFPGITRNGYGRDAVRADATEGGRNMTLRSAGLLPFRTVIAGFPLSRGSTSPVELSAGLMTLP